MAAERAELYDFGGFRLDVGEHRLTRFDGKSDGSLPEKAFRTLVHLVRHRGTLVTHDELLEAVWQGTVVEKNNIGKAVHAVRSFLGDTNGKPRFIETIPKSPSGKILRRVLRDGDRAGQIGAVWRKATAG